MKKTTTTTTTTRTTLTVFFQATKLIKAKLFRAFNTLNHVAVDQMQNLLFKFTRARDTQHDFLSQNTPKCCFNSNVNEYKIAAPIIFIALMPEWTILRCLNHAPVSTRWTPRWNPHWTTIKLLAPLWKKDIKKIVWKKTSPWQCPALKTFFFPNAVIWRNFWWFVIQNYQIYQHWLMISHTGSCLLIAFNK